MTSTAPDGPPRFRCAAASAVRGEDMAGSASTVRAFLLVEDPGPWGVQALRDSRLPDQVKGWLSGLEPRLGVRPLLVRRPGTRPGPRRGGPVRVLAARVDGPEPWLERTTLPDVLDVPDLDLRGLRRGTTVGLEPHPGPLLLVCTHGRHDPCCAELGRPLASALAAHAPEETWEVSHLGGDRFAGNVLVLPQGLYYGRLTASDAAELAADTLGGRLDLAHLRGRTAYPFPVQAAEIHLRRHLDLRTPAPLPLVARSQDGDVTTAVFAAADAEWEVEVRTTEAAPERLTCRSTRHSTAPAYRVVGLRRC